MQLTYYVYYFCYGELPHDPLIVMGICRTLENVYVKSLEPCHGKQVHDYWPYKAYYRVDDVVDEIEKLPSAGVFLKDTNELVSWIMCHPPSGMSRLHTLENHRHRGYATLVTQYLSKRIAQTGCIPFVNIMTDNNASRKFFESMGFIFLCNSELCEREAM